MRSLWKGKFITIDFVLGHNKDFKSEYNIYKANVFCMPLLKAGYFIYRGNRFEFLESDLLMIGFKLVSFLLTKKIGNLHVNNKVFRKQRARKLEMQKKVNYI